MKYDFDEVIGRSGTGALKYDQRKVVFGTDDVIPMWVADMDFRTPDVIMQAIRERTRHEILGYSVRTNAFYSAIIDWVWKRHGWNIEKEWIVFSPGVVPAINICVLSYTRPGDEIIIQPPVYFPFFKAVTDHQRKPVFNKLVYDNLYYHFDLHYIGNIPRNSASMLILSNPHNPVGRLWTRHELEELAGLCIERNILILSDEIHCDLVFKPFKHVPLASIGKKIADHTITCMAPSKTFNLAGLSTSFLIIPDAGLREKYTRVQESLHLGMGNIFGNVALEAAYRNGMPWLDEMLDYTRNNILYVERYLKEKIPLIRMVPVEATYLIWLDCHELARKAGDLRDFFIHKARVVLSDGALFGPGGEGFMRMNVACPFSIVKNALQQIEAAVNTL